MSETVDLKPLIYQHVVSVRFSDLDPYGHVNSKHYLDYVISSRWMFTQEQFNMTDKEFTKKGVAFYLARSECQYLKPIEGVQNLWVTSHLSSVEGSRATVAFEIYSSDQKRLFSKGSLVFAVMNLETLRPQRLPEWVYPYFYESAMPAIQSE